MTPKEKLPTLGQRLADSISAVIRSWTFVVCQMIFIGAWIVIANHFPALGLDDKSFDILRLVLTIESSFVGSILLMAQNRQSEKDRKMLYTDYILNRQTYKEMREIHPMINDIHKKNQEHQ